MGGNKKPQANSSSSNSGCSASAASQILRIVGLCLICAQEVFFTQPQIVCPKCTRRSHSSCVYKKESYTKLSPEERQRWHCDDCIPKGGQELASASHVAAPVAERHDADLDLSIVRYCESCHLGMCHEEVCIVCSKCTKPFHEKCANKKNGKDWYCGNCVLKLAVQPENLPSTSRGQGSSTGRPSAANNHMGRNPGNVANRFFTANDYANLMLKLNEILDDLDLINEEILGYGNGNVVMENGAYTLIWEVFIGPR